MSVEEALMLLDRLCENDNPSNQTYEVDPVIALSSDATLSLSNLNSNPDKQTTDFNSDSHIESTIDSNNNSFNIEEPENLFESLEEESSIEYPNDPDFNINEENGDSSDGEANKINNNCRYSLLQDVKDGLIQMTARRTLKKYTTETFLGHVLLDLLLTNQHADAHTT
uniref:Uncharacterized protein n=1 Tax=Magallana gigas TaxID=29159 RepID=K1PN81_MAGGI